MIVWFIIRTWYHWDNVLWVHSDICFSIQYKTGHNKACIFYTGQAFSLKKMQHGFSTFTWFLTKENILSYGHQYILNIFNGLQNNAEHRQKKWSLQLKRIAFLQKKYKLCLREKHHEKLPYLSYFKSIF